MASARENEIGARFRTFREMLQISRSKFAVSIGFGSERIASYESGRAPLPYAVFRAASQRYNLSPFWLSGENCSPNGRINDDAFFAKIGPRALFTSVYDEFICSNFHQLQADAKEQFQRIQSALEEQWKRIKDKPPDEEPLKTEVLQTIRSLEALIKNIRRDLRVRAKARRAVKN